MINDFFCQKDGICSTLCNALSLLKYKKNFVNIFQIEPATKVILIYLRTMPLKKHEFFFNILGY